ncbi:hypothetical protein [Rhodanobacter sp. L36]|uniref:hypothetical protein n=1 Tax=Rhodanobacter sp. L36 TaxID=1747221 RepID=UPI00131E2B57|nr:hypothetical protein [Rhodanobacter sp. L36]
MSANRADKSSSAEKKTPNLRTPVKKNAKFEQQLADSRDHDKQVGKRDVTSKPAKPKTK